jgi:hypothetical protein
MDYVSRTLILSLFYGAHVHKKEPLVGAQIVSTYGVYNLIATIFILSVCNIVNYFINPGEEPDPLMVGTPVVLYLIYVYFLFYSNKIFNSRIIVMLETKQHSQTKCLLLVAGLLVVSVFNFAIVIRAESYI